MWIDQELFQQTTQCLARQLFEDRLDDGYRVETFLIGLREEIGGNDPASAVVLVPDSIGFKREDFADVRRDAARLRELDHDDGIVTASIPRNEAMRAQIERRASKRAVLEVLTSWWWCQRPGDFYFSGFQKVGGDEMGIGMRLWHESDRLTYRLPRTYAEDRNNVPTCFVDGLADIFLGRCAEELRVGSFEEVDTAFSIDDIDTLLRRAGKKLLEIPIWATDAKEGLYGLHNYCDLVASLTYEQAEAAGKMIVACRDHPNVEKVLTFSKPVHLKEDRAVRKLLQTAKAGISLLTDGHLVFGIGRIIGNYDQTEANLFEVIFFKRHSWELRHGGQPLVRYRYGVPGAARPALDTTRLQADVEKVFPDIASNQVVSLVELAVAACNESHGALLVITDEADSEVARLSPQCTPVDPVLLTPMLVASAAAIDGAVMLNSSGVCHGIGAILDGKATQQGDASRGARYNSALRYVSGRANCMAIIVSEDGMVQWI